METEPLPSMYENKMWTADVYTPEGLVGFLSLSGIFQVYYFIKETHRGCVWWHMPFNPSTWEADTDLCEFKASLIYKESSRRAAKIIQEDLCLKNQKGKKNPQSKASGDPCRKQTALPIEGGHRVLQCVASGHPRTWAVWGTETWLSESLNTQPLTKSKCCWMAALNRHHTAESDCHISHPHTSSSPSLYSFTGVKIISVLSGRP